MDQKKQQNTGQGVTYDMASHRVTCHPTAVAFPPSPQPKLVLDLATHDGWVDLVLVTPKDSLPAKDQY